MRYRRVIVIWPWSKAPKQLVEPVYDPRIRTIMSSMSNVPVTCPVHPDIGIVPFGMVIVKVPVLPFIVPDTIIWPTP